jgi:hypothetical protein
VNTDASVANPAHGRRDGWAVGQLERNGFANMRYFAATYHRSRWGQIDDVYIKRGAAPDQRCAGDGIGAGFAALIEQALHAPRNHRSFQSQSLDHATLAFGLT